MRKLKLAFLGAIIIGSGFIYLRGSKLKSDSQLTTEQYNTKYKK